MGVSLVIISLELHNISWNISKDIDNIELTVQNADSAYQYLTHMKPIYNLNTYRFNFHFTSVGIIAELFFNLRGNKVFNPTFNPI